MASLAQLIASATLNLIFGWLVMLSIGFAGLAEWLVHFVLSPNFINIPYTTNEFVTLGWTLTRDFANIFFIIVLVIIGLATALRLGEYQWQKTLPLLIGIALLINFTPVILGLIIDASNIIMDFFVSGIAEKGFFAPLMDAWVSNAFEITQRASWLEIAITPGFFIAFNFTAGIIYLLFAVLFIMRYLALWTLVILSPIAFLCYILPRTRQVFEMWWNQFLQWCIIGIAATFFLYLANQLLFLIIANPGFVNKGNREGWGLINSLVPYSVVLGFLIIGFFVSLTTSAMGAAGIITAAQKGVKTAGKWTGKKVGRGIEKGLKIPKGAERLGRWAAGKPIFGVAARPLVGYAKRRHEEEKKELEGLPFATRAKIIRRRGQSVQDSLRDVVKGLDPRKFASEAHPDDITLDVLRAMSMKQVTVTGERGSTNLKESIRNQYIRSHQAIMDEWKKLRKEGKFVEATNLRDKTKYIMRNYIT